MGVLFGDGFLDGFGTWPLGYIRYGGPDFGEFTAVAKAIGGSQRLRRAADLASCRGCRPPALPTRPGESYSDVILRQRRAAPRSNPFA